MNIMKKNKSKKSNSLPAVATDNNVNSSTNAHPIENELDIPVFIPEKKEIPQPIIFDFEKYASTQRSLLEARLEKEKEEYNVFFKQLYEAFIKEKNRGNKYCTIEIEKSNSFSDMESNWENDISFIQLKAIEKFLYILKTKGYPYTFEFKCLCFDQPNDEDGTTHQVWKEIQITLK